MTKNNDELIRWKELARLEPNQAVSEFSELAPKTAEIFVQGLGIPFFIEWISGLATDSAASVLRNLSEALQHQILVGMPPVKSAQIQELLAYAPGTAGALMAKEYLAISVEATLGEAAAYLRRLSGSQKGKISYIYAVDSSNRLEGVLQIRDLVFYPPEKKVSDVLRKPVVQVETGMTQLDVAKLLEKHHYLGLPVVDAAQKLVGVISADNALKVFQEEAEDDLAKMIGTGAEEIRSHSVLKVMGLRLPWLFVNIASGLMCAVVSGIFQQGAPKLAVLFLFVPLVLGLSESTGVQGATLVVRNLALGNAAFKDLRALFFRELLVGILIGLICGMVVGGSAYLWKDNVLLGAAIASSMMLAIMTSAVIGLMLPVFFRQFKMDPAIGSGPIVLAVCDLQTLLVYFNLSNFILHL